MSRPQPPAFKWDVENAMKEHTLMVYTSLHTLFDPLLNHKAILLPCDGMQQVVLPNVSKWCPAQMTITACRLHLYIFPGLQPPYHRTITSTLPLGFKVHSKQSIPVAAAWYRDTCGPLGTQPPLKSPHLQRHSIPASWSHGDWARTCSGGPEDWIPPVPSNTTTWQGTVAASTWNAY